MELRPAMSETIQCPVEGCEYEGVKDSVLGHYSGKRDDDHPGGYEHAKTLFDDDSSPQTDSNEDPEPSNENPTMGNADPEPSEPQDNTFELECGHESIDLSKYDPPIAVTCDTCGQSWRLSW